MKQTPEHVAGALLNSLEAAQAQIDFLVSHYKAKNDKLLADGVSRLNAVNTLLWDLQQGQEKLRDLVADLTSVLEDLPK